MVEFRDVVKKYTDPGEALGRDPDTGDVTGLEVDPVAVVTDPAAQAALSATFALLATEEWIGPNAWSVRLGAPALGALNNRHLAWLLDDGSTESVRASFRPPSHWAAWKPVFMLAALTAPAGSVRIGSGVFTSGVKSGAVLGTTAETTVSTVPLGAQFEVVEVDGPTVATSGAVTFYVYREGGHADDSHVGDVAFLGCELRKVGG